MGLRTRILLYDGFLPGPHLLDDHVAVEPFHDPFDLGQLVAGHEEEGRGVGSHSFVCSRCQIDRFDASHATAFTHIAGGFVGRITATFDNPAYAFVNEAEQSFVRSETPRSLVVHPPVLC
jgi:hypothetical protein